MNIFIVLSTLLIQLRRGGLVQRSGADLVAMPPQFIDHGEAVDRLLRGMMKTVDLDQAG
jgi:hypothetical protein